jgi:hypothetical protein
MKTHTIKFSRGLLFTAFASATLLFVSNAAAQNVGIGVPSPQSKLTVNGNLAVGASYNVVAPTNGAIIQGTVGIGTSSPNANSMLHIFNANQAEEIIEGGGGSGPKAGSSPAMPKAMVPIGSASSIKPTRFPVSSSILPVASVLAVIHLEPLWMFQTVLMST